MFTQGTPLAAIARIGQSHPDAYIAAECGGPALVMLAQVPNKTAMPIFTTRHVSEHHLQDAEDGEVVYFVRKRPGGALKQIGIGRAGNVDISILSGALSKYHAFFLEEAPSLWTITDAGSKNGTTVENVPLAAGKRHTLGSGDRIGLADVRLAFYPVADFVSRCRADG